MSWPENRLLRAEASIEDLYRILQQPGGIKDQLAALRQSLRAASQALPPGGPQSSGVGSFTCMCPTAVAGLWDGTEPTEPGSFQAEVYQCIGSTSEDMGLQTVYNWMPAATVANKPCMLGRDGQGNFVVLSQSCV